MITAPKPPYLGGAYYPELWPLENIDNDIKQMKEAGCNLMRIAEFAWGAMEPTEGDYQFEWLHTVVDKLTESGIAVIMCTPSCTPPQWLTDLNEDTCVMSSLGVRAQHGARRHACPNSPTIREYNRKIVLKMVDEIGNHPGIIGWQIDNEIHPWGGCFCPICRRKFQQWLENKYKSIDDLNDKWGMYRWSLTYADFTNIIPPRTDTWNHPSLVSAYKEFMSDSYVEYMEDQVTILKAHLSVPIGTDMMPVHGYDYYDVNKKLDVVQFNHYDEAHNLHRLPIWFDFIRPIKGVPFWNTETQANWNGSEAASPCRPENFCYVNSWLPIAYGGEMNLYWLWKSHPNGHEIMHGAVVSSSGRFLHTVNEIKRLSEEYGKASEFINNTKVKPDIALHFSDTAHRQFSAVPIVQGFDYNRSIIDSFYLPLTQTRHLNLDVIDTPKELDNYKIIFSPFLCSMEEHNFKTRIKNWVENGGTWIVGPLSDMSDIHLSQYTHAPFGSLEEWGGIYCKYQIPTNDLNLPELMLSKWV